MRRCRELYNTALEQRKTWWDRGQGKNATYYQQKAELPDRKAAYSDYAPITLRPDHPTPRSPNAPITLRPDQRARLAGRALAP